MNRQAMFRLPLSVVLLFSQPMARAHAIEHLGAALHSCSACASASTPGTIDAGDGASELAKAEGEHQNGHQCRTRSTCMY